MVYALTAINIRYKLLHFKYHAYIYRIQSKQRQSSRIVFIRTSYNGIRHLMLNKSLINRGNLFSQSVKIYKKNYTHFSQSI